MGIQERKAREKRARQELIVRSAQHVFLEKGFDQTTIEDIAEVAELSKGALYLYFKGKEELYLAVFRRGLEDLYDQINALRGEAGAIGAENLLRRLLDVYYEFFHRSPEFIYTTSQVYHGRIQEKVAPDLWESVVTLGRSCLAVFSDIICQGVEDGSFREVDCWKTASAFWSAMTGVMMVNDDEREARVIDVPQRELLEYTFEMLMRSLRA